jgi:hypothetical protein
LEAIGAIASNERRVGARRSSTASKLMPPDQECLPEAAVAAVTEKVEV